MKIGITGSRKGPTLAQLTTITHELLTVRDTLFSVRREVAQEWVQGGHEEVLQGEPHELHHGDCVGVDATVAAIAAGLGYRTVAHPPVLLAYRARHPSDEVRPPQGYLERDRDIVNEVDLLIACPDGPKREGSGTWYTINYAKRRRRNLMLIDPDDGTIHGTIHGTSP